MSGLTKQQVAIGLAGRCLMTAVEASGGLVINDEGQVGVAADPTWTDMAQVYIAMCRAYGRYEEMPEPYDNNDDPAYPRELR
jgi:hypothetical protein